MPATPELTPAEVDASRALHWLMPLHFFYEKRARQLPSFRFIEGPSMPEPWRGLLVHHEDMTPTLARHHGAALRLEVLDREMSRNYLLRLVILRRQDSLMPVECGAIAIHLDRFPESARSLIEEGQVPLGGILEREEIPHRGRPRGYFEVAADSLVANALGEDEGTSLFGRCNELSFPDGEAFADIVEILPGTA